MDARADLGEDVLELAGTVTLELGRDLVVGSEPGAARSRAW